MLYCGDGDGCGRGWSGRRDAAAPGAQRGGGGDGHRRGRRGRRLHCKRGELRVRSDIGHNQRQPLIYPLHSFRMNNMCSDDSDGCFDSAVSTTSNGYSSCTQAQHLQTPPRFRSSLRRSATAGRRSTPRRRRGGWGLCGRSSRRGRRSRLETACVATSETPPPPPRLLCSGSRCRCRG